MWGDCWTVIDNVVLQTHEYDFWSWQLSVDKIYNFKEVYHLLTTAEPIHQNVY